MQFNTPHNLPPKVSENKEDLQALEQAQGIAECVTIEAGSSYLRTLVCVYLLATSLWLKDRLFNDRHS